MSCSLSSAGTNIPVNLFVGHSSEGYPGARPARVGHDRPNVRFLPPFIFESAVVLRDNWDQSTGGSL